MAPSNEKAAALDALRVWRGWNDRRDPLIYAAHLAGASLAEIHEASGVAKNTARTAISTQGEAVNRTATTDRLAEFHHPHFVAVEPGRMSGYWRFTFKPFTGTEPEPSRPVASYRNEQLTDEDGALLEMEYRAATESWAAARFTYTARPLLAAAGRAWQDHIQARDAIGKAFADLLSTSDNTWRAQIMVLTDLHRVALDAARKWDTAAKPLAEAYDDYEHTVDWATPMAQLVPETAAWEVAAAYDYKGWSSPAVVAITAEIERQKGRLREVAELAGDR